MIKSFQVILFSVLFSSYFWAQGSVVDKIVAQVGDNIILLSDIEGQKVQAVQAGVVISPMMDCNLLEQMLFEELFVNQAKLDSIIISDEQVDAEMENRIRVIQSKIGSREKLEEFYGKTISQIKDEFRVAIKDKLLAQEMQRSITENISVTPKEVQAYYKNLNADSIPFINMKLSFQQIVNYPQITKADKLIAFNKLSEIRTEIVANGKSFETQARINSDDFGSAQLGGKITGTKGMMVSQFEATVFNLKPLEVSELIETEFGYHIIKLISRKGDDYVCLHILKRPEFNNQSLDISASLMDSCHALLKENKITWDDAVVHFSNDDLTKQNHGIISNPYTGEQTWNMEDLNEIDQQIYLLTDAMEKGDITAPNLYTDLFERKQGIRIVRLMGRYEQHKANLTDDYALIKAAAENDKKQRTLDNWLKGKIGNAYVRIDEDFVNCNFRLDWGLKQ
jgi:peptidyl-prolyl cis-trans isomerase SurA